VSRFKVAAFSVTALLVMAVPAMAQEDSNPLINVGGAAFGIGVLVFGAAMGIGKIGTAAVESMARQPEVAGDIRGAMVVAAALIEGATFFGILMAYLTA
jgi:F-type H+-transporting ATPase subunit c